MAQRSRDHRAYAGLNPAQGPPAATYQTRVSGYVGLDREAGDAALAAYAELYGQVERKLFADVAAGRSAAVPRQLYLPVGVNQFCRFTSSAWPRCWAALVR